MAAKTTAWENTFSPAKNRASHESFLYFQLNINNIYIITTAEKSSMSASAMSAIILAAGKGTRMHSQHPKVLQTLLGEPMLALVINALEPVFHENILIVTGFKNEEVAASFPGMNFVIQESQLGTAHALSRALEAMKNSLPERILVVNGDTPLIQPDIITNFIGQAKNADIAFATITLPDAGAYGRVVRKNGDFIAIVEAKDFNEEIHGAAGGEINTGLWCIRTDVALDLLPKIDCKNRNNEYYITDLAALGLQWGLTVLPITLGDNADLLGVNSPQELAAMENRLAERVNSSLLASGVILHHPAALRISPLARIMPGAEINGPTQIIGRCDVASGTKIGPFCHIRNSVIASNCQINPFSHLENAVLGENCVVGPYCRLRPGTRMEEGSHAGNFVELKNTVLGSKAKANHLSYLGDSSIGSHANIGAGTITCNYDGKNKHRTEIGEKAFIGSNTALVAPVSIGDGALVGAGSVITKNVPANDLAIGRAKQKNMPRKFMKNAEKDDEGK